jgi:RNA polymerase sigma factor (sigma-70 family)
MASDGSITRWIGQLQTGDRRGAQELWERYFRRLVGLARKKLQETPRRAADEEDVALSAFHSFCRAAEQGRFPRLDDRHDVWQLLMTITSRKACHLLRDQWRLKRGGAPEGDLGRGHQDDPSVEEIVGDEPTPELAVQVAEEYRRLLELLGSKELEAVALHKMEGHSNEEIAGLLGCATRTVERKLKLIRDIWEKEMVV